MSITNHELTVCASCLGDSQEIEKVIVDSKCHFCQLPYDVYKWVTDRELRTHICGNCAQNENVCQRCIKDLEFQISLPLKNRCLEIIKEENGDLENKELVHSILSKMKQLEPQPNKKNHKSLLKVFDGIPEFSTEINQRPENCNCLYVFGIEEDLSISALRDYYVEECTVEMVPKARFAYMEFPNKVPDVKSPIFVDHRKLYLVWGAKVKVPFQMQSTIGALVRLSITEAQITDDNDKTAKESSKESGKEKEKETGKEKQ